MDGEDGAVGFVFGRVGKAAARAAVVRGQSGVRLGLGRRGGGRVEAEGAFVGG